MQPGQIHGFAVFLGCGQYLVALWAAASETDVYPCEAAREKINHFLRKFILFFVSLFVTLFHFLKSDVTVAFYFTNYI